MPPGSPWAIRCLCSISREGLVGFLGLLISERFWHLVKKRGREEVFAAHAFSLSVTGKDGGYDD